jgi:phosphatidylglycerol:prolipoprotein diacylglycerol transferase
MYHCGVLAQSYIHKLDPFAIQITETLGLRWYGLAYIAGFVTAWIVIKWMSRNNITQIQPNKVGDFIFACVVGVLAGGRLGYVFFYDPTLLYTFTPELPWWRVLAIQDGGMSSHGGMIGVSVALIVWGKKNNISILHLIDIAALFTIPGLFYGRIANFINGELWGKKLPESLQAKPPWWSIKYPTEITEVWLASPQLYQEKLNTIEPLRSQIVGGDYFYQSVVQEAYAGNQQVIESIQPNLTAWYPSQLFQAAAEGPVLFIALFLIWWNPRKPGIIAGWFAILYGILRIITEEYRQPDAGVALLFNFSRGQLLSATMILVGIFYLTISARRSSEKASGFKYAFNKKTQTT